MPYTGSWSTHVRNKTVLQRDEIPAHDMLQNRDLPFTVSTHRLPSSSFPHKVWRVLLQGAGSSEDCPSESSLLNIHYQRPTALARLPCQHHHATNMKHYGSEPKAKAVLNVVRLKATQHTLCATQSWP